MTAPPARRTLLGTDRSLADRSRVYRTADALEVDLIDHYEIRRRRVFFDEVRLVTLHSGRGAWSLAVALGLLAVCSGVALAVLAMAPSGGGLGRKILLGDTFTLALLALAAGFIPVWTVTVFGKRTRARMRFRLRAGKARAVYAEITRAAAAAQQEAARRIAAPAPDIPLPSPPRTE